MKIWIMSSTDKDLVEEDTNEFIADKIADKKIVNIKFSTAYDDFEQDVKYSVMVMYEDKLKIDDPFLK